MQREKKIVRRQKTSKHDIAGYSSVRFTALTLNVSRRPTNIDRSKRKTLPIHQNLTEAV
jgi:hypothetical protein